MFGERVRKDKNETVFMSEREREDYCRPFTNWIINELNELEECTKAIIVVEIVNTFLMPLFEHSFCWFIPIVTKYIFREILHYTDLHIPT